LKDTVVMESSQSPKEARATVVRTKLVKLSASIEDGFFDICELLAEAQQHDYHHVWGFERFQDWIETASGLDMSGRQAFYMIQIANRAKQLGLTRDQLKLIKISKLKQIFSLDPDQFAAEIKALIEEAPGLSLDEVTNRVRALKGQSEQIFMTIKVERSIKDTIDRALELAKRNYGSVMLGHDATDISTSQCMELLCVSYVQDPNNSPEGQEIAEEQE